MRIFLDANILFSAALPKSRMREFLEVISSKADFLTNAYALEEARRNLELKFPENLKALERLTKKCEMISQLAADLEIELPLKDKPILGGAIAGRATHLLTGDERDFGKFWGRTIQGVKIVSPKMLAQELL
ncbi:MAG TPA: DNA-binding protein [Methylomirabilota bacterium]|nr:DNA-binding protein [Methylomirabilota bacterium]